MAQRNTLTTAGASHYEDLEHELVHGKGAKRTYPMVLKYRTVTIGANTYHGQALPGTAEDEAGWKIFRQDADSNIDFADGVSGFIHTWSSPSLASLPYL